MPPFQKYALLCPAPRVGGRPWGRGPSSFDAVWLAGPEYPSLRLGLGTCGRVGATALWTADGEHWPTRRWGLRVWVMWFLPLVSGGREGPREGRGPDSQLIISIPTSLHPGLEWRGDSQAHTCPFLTYILSAETLGPGRPLGPPPSPWSFSLFRLSWLEKVTTPTLVFPNSPNEISTYVPRHNPP